MMSCRTVAVWICLLLISTGLPKSADAHKVSIFAWVEEGRVHTQSTFMGGKAPKNARVEVLDSAGNRLLEGYTDPQGNFSFSTPEKRDMTVILHAGMGHRATWKIRADEFEDPMKAGRQDRTVPDRSTRDVADDPLTEEDVTAIVSKMLDQKLAPILKMQAESSRQTPSLNDIIAGIGIIFGIVGVIAYVRSRRRGGSGS